MKTLIFSIFETDFGAEAECAVTFKNGVAVSIRSNGKRTNYCWDGFEESFLRDLYGKSENEVQNIFYTYFDDFDDEYRRPFVAINKVEYPPVHWRKIPATEEDFITAGFKRR